MSKVTQQAESFYGMGDKASHTNLKGKRVNNWVTDQYAYHKDQEPLYKSIPFYIGLQNEIAYGFSLTIPSVHTLILRTKKETSPVFGQMEEK